MFSTQGSNISTVVDFVALTAKKLNDQGKNATADGLLLQALTVVQGHPLLQKLFLEKTIDIYPREAAEDYFSEYLEPVETSYEELFSLLRSGKEGEARECFHRYFVNFLERENGLKERRCYALVGKACSRLGRYKEAVEWFGKSLTIALDLGLQSVVKDLYRNLADGYNTLGQYSLSVSFSEKALSLCEEMGNRLERIDDYFNLGESYRNLEQFDKAIAYYKKTLDLSLVLSNRLAEGQAYLGLGGVYLRTGQYQNAKEYCEKSVDIGLEMNYPSLKQGGYQGLGHIYTILGQLDKAIEFYEKYLAISLKMGNQSAVGLSYGCLANVYETVAKYDEAMDYYNKALSICLETGNRSTESFCYAGLGKVYEKVGKYEEAIDYLEKSSTICLENGERVSTCYVNLGNVYFNKGQFEKAGELYRKSLTISLKTGDRYREATCYEYLGTVCHSVGDYEEAVLSYEKALAICVEIGYRRGEGSNHSKLGTVYCNLQEYQKAVDHCKKSLAIHLEIGDRVGEASNYGSLADVYRILGRYEKAVVYDTKSLDVFVAIGYRSGVANTYSCLGLDYRRLLQHCKSIECYKKGLDIALEIGEKVEKFYGYLGCAYVEARQYETSEYFLKKAVEESDKFLLELVADKSKTWVSRKYYQWHIALMISYFFVGNNRKAFLVLDLGKAKALQILKEQCRIAQSSKTCKEPGDSYQSQTWRRIEDGEEEERIRDIAGDLNLKDNNATVLVYDLELYKPTMRMALIIWVLNSDGELNYRTWAPDGENVSADDWLYEATESLFSSVSVQLRRDCSFFCSLLPEPVITQLKDNTSFNDLPYVCEPFNIREKEVNDNSNEIKLVRAGPSPSDKLGSATNTCGPGMAKMFPNNVTLGATQEDVLVTNPTFKENTTNLSQDSKLIGSVEPACAWDSSSLYDALIRPVTDIINGTKLIIVPDKMLFFMPFCMLQNEHGLSLSESYSIQVTPSLHTLALGKKISHSTNFGPALFVGNPKVGRVMLFGQPREVSSLPAAKEEVRSLALRFNARPLVEDEATKDRVLKCIDSASVIHIAAHGLRRHGEVLLAPSVVAKQVETLPTEISYLLNQSDIINRQLSARLVVLCCCYTGRGEPTSEGVLGIARSFLCAGARSVLISLWALHDIATKVFMEHFYDEICRGTSICEALQMTMNAFQQSDNIEHRSFRTWAPFTIIGEDVRFTKEDIEKIRSSSERTVN